MRNLTAVLFFALFAVSGLCAPAAHAGEASANPVVVVDTSAGAFELELYADKAPGTVKNFLAYAQEKFYDGTVFHRVIKGFMIQGGGFTPDLKQKAAHDPIRNEASAGLRNVTGTIAMARMPEPHTASAEFFINVADNAMLDHRSEKPEGFGYCVFGRVVKGLDVVLEISTVQTHGSQGVIQNMRVPMENVPVKTIKINSVQLKDAAKK